MDMIGTSNTRMPGIHHRAEVNGIRLHYTAAGTGEPLVLLHGFPMTSYHWRKIMPALAERFTVIAPDLRGCGDSDRPTSGYDKRTVAEDIHQLVRHLDLGSINLVTRLPATRPGLVLCCVGLQGDAGSGG